MALLDLLRKTSGLIKNRAASAVGALRTTRVGRVGISFARRTPVGLAITAATFGPQIARGIRTAGGFLRTAAGKAIAFLGGRQVATAGVAGFITGIIPGQFTPLPPGQPERPTSPGENGPGPTGNGPRAPTKPKTAAEKARAAARKKAAARRKRIPRHRHKVISVPVRRRKTGPRKKRTHRSPRHRGHKRVSFTTKTGQKVSFLVNPKARHR